ncbi:MAG: phosphatidylinositol dimannoside acyltransferase [Actinomycetota bacterium]|nr:phosphatidylinositol dimannoside acyltransferase [Actinomycetota bacterium]
MSRALDAYRAGAAVARVLPGPIAALASRGIGAGMALSGAERRRIVARHQQRAHGGTLSPPALRAAVRRAFDSYARYWVESFRLPKMTPRDLDDAMTHEGFEHVLDALDEGKGAILVIPHLGCWDYAGAWVATQGIPITVIVEPLEPPELFEWFAEFRRSLGMTVVPLGPDVASASMRALRNNELLCLLSDRDISGGGVEVSFFGETTTLSGGAATLAMRTGAPIIPVGAYYRGDLHHGVVRPRIPVERTGRLRDDVTRVTQLVAHELEALIRKAPEQWHLMQPNWPSDAQV